MENTDQGIILDDVDNKCVSSFSNLTEPPISQTEDINRSEEETPSVEICEPKNPEADDDVPMEIVPVKQECTEDNPMGFIQIENVMSCVSFNNTSSEENHLPVGITQIKEEINLPTECDNEKEYLEIEVPPIKSEICTKSQESYNYYNDQNETFISNSIQVVPVALKSTSEFAIDDDEELIVPVENPLPVRANGTADEGKEMIIDNLNELQNVDDELDDLLAPRGFACLICNKTYINLNTFQKHQEAHELAARRKRRGRPKKVKLPARKVPVENVSDVEDPEDISENENNVYNCGCGKEFRRKMSYLACMKVHQNSGLGCQWCKRVFDKQADLRKHCRSIHFKVLKTRRPCPTCGKAFLSIKCLKKHIKALHGNIDEKELNAINAFERNSKGKKIQRPCPVCNKVFLSLKCLNKHINAVHETKKVEEKGKDKEEDSIKNSLRTRNRQPQSYEKDVSIKKNLRIRNRQQQSHKEEDKDVITILESDTEQDVVVDEPSMKTRKPRKNKVLNESTLKFKFVCPTCGDQFSTLGALTEHKEIHKKPAKFSCDRCKEKFSSKNELSTHKLTHRRDKAPKSPEIDKSNICEICEAAFPNEKMKLEHKSTHPFVIFAKDDSTHTQIFFK